jgi:hypothetical protein
MVKFVKEIGSTFGKLVEIQNLTFNAKKSLL